MSFLQLVLLLDKTKDGFNSILPIVSLISQHHPLNQWLLWVTNGNQGQTVMEI